MAGNGDVRWRKLDRYDPLRDPEEVYLTIRGWLTSGKVRNVSEGVRRYLEKKLKDATSEGTVRVWYYEGRKLWNAHEPPAYSERNPTA